MCCSSRFYFFSNVVCAFLRAGEDGNFNHGCNVLADLVRPWANTDRVVVGDSYFASVQAALRLKDMGLRFIGVVKTAHKGFPMHYLSRIVLPDGKGDYRALLHTDAESGTSVMACVWADRERRYFVSTCSSTSPGMEINRYRWRQRDETPNAAPVRENIRLPQPQVVQVYYDGASKIDQHNRHRQDSLNLEKKVQTNAWERRTNVSIFAMIVVDSFYLFSGVRGGVTKVRARSYYEQLAVELIENDYDRMSLRRRREEVMELERALTAQGAPMLDPVKQLTAPTPTKRHKKNKPTHRVQGRCMVCSKLTSHVCRDCQQFNPSPLEKQFWICNKAGKVCMGKHILERHPNKVDT